MTNARTCQCGARLEKVFRDARVGFDRHYVFYRCGRCDLISPDPFPARERVIAQYDGYGSYADASYHHAARQAKRVQAKRLVRKFQRALGRERARRARLLEVGCAAGALLSNLSELGVDVRGVEIDPRNAAVAREALGDRVFTGTLDAAAFPSGSFDVVYADQVIEHVLDTEPFLRECLRILAPGGVFYVATPNFVGVSSRALGVRWKEFAPTEHIRMFTPRSLEYWARRAGFAELAVSTVGLWPRLHDRRDMLPAMPALARRILAKGLGLARVGDGLSLIARKSR